MKLLKSHNATLERDADGSAATITNTFITSLPRSTQAAWQSAAVLDTNTVSFEFSVAYAANDKTLAGIIPASFNISQTGSALCGGYYIYLPGVNLVYAQGI